MVAALIFVLSIAALIRFGVAQWKSIWQTVADQPLTESLQSVSGIASDAIGPDDFEKFMTVCRKTCRLPRQSNIWLNEVRIYYQLLRMLRHVGSKASPSIARWAEKESIICSRYAGAVLDRSLNASFAYASLRGH